MTKNDALKLLAGNQPLCDLLLKQMREAIKDGVSSAETDAEVLAKYGTASVEPIVPNTTPAPVEDDEEYESSDSYEEEYYASSDDC